MRHLLFFNLAELEVNQAGVVVHRRVNLVDLLVACLRGAVQFLTSALDLIEVVLFVFMVTVFVMEVYSVIDVIDRVINVLSEERADGDDGVIKMVHFRKLWTAALSGRRCWALTTY